MSEYNEGDLVEAVRTEIASSTRLRGLLVRYRHNSTKSFIVAAQHYQPDLNWLLDQGFAVTVIEKAKPPLPSTPGVVIAWESPYCKHLATLEKTDQWLHGESTYTNAEMAERIADTVAAGSGFTVLRPVAEVAAEVLGAVLHDYTTATSFTNLHEVTHDLAAKYGATL